MARSRIGALLEASTEYMWRKPFLRAALIKCSIKAVPRRPTLHQSPTMLRAVALAKVSGAVLAVRALVEPAPIVHLREEKIDEARYQRYLRRYRLWVADEVRGSAAKAWTRRSKSADVVVMGTAHRVGIDWLIGSNTERALCSVPGSNLAVKPSVRG